jgi:hypothetical protein
MHTHVLSTLARGQPLSETADVTVRLEPHLLGNKGTVPTPHAACAPRSDIVVSTSEE